ncbi:hypothetical protein [Streptomyces cahuitamycinicus]|uniref:Uncharacterized protein n=1 Tax=Streptomyces cahuitamycinicus TaxID=2070367 RepID=A0A2N8TUC6_9ACTN|nr:hypothetical protein [Streptomyces cahuitamycinicus]PNG22634.1 hypothetical protein C1J00_08360 [Streptomyces cahuitamycinicus]
MTVSRACRTCGTMQEFRMFNAAERAVVRAMKGAGHFVDDYWRCTAVGCRWYQRYLNRGEDGLLPEELKIQAVPAE